MVYMLLLFNARLQLENKNKCGLTFAKCESEQLFDCINLVYSSLSKVNIFAKFIVLVGLTTFN